MYTKNNAIDFSFWKCKQAFEKSTFKKKFEEAKMLIKFSLTI